MQKGQTKTFKSVVILPCLHLTDGTVELQTAGPNLYTTHWSVHRRAVDGSLEWETDARDERAAKQVADNLAREFNLEVEPYTWAATPLLTACAFALRTTFGIDLYEAGVQSEQDLHKRGITTLEMAQSFALEVGRQFELERIDV
jgi:hypothetical protein